MANVRSGKCKCPSRKRYVSSGICSHTDCIDVCSTPICGTPDNLTLLAPVVYDEIGINLCRTIPLPGAATDITTNNAVAASIQVLDVTFATTGADAVTITQISGRPNCYLITLTNLTVTFLITLYNCARQVISTLTETAVYLPPAGSADFTYFDEETNPSSVELEIFAPYGIAYDTTGTTPTALLNYVGFTATNNMLEQGLNLIAIPKILNFDLSEPAITVGISLYLKSVYFSQYLLPHNGRAIVPKGTLIPDDDTVCMDFVCGELLDYSIKPLELGPPKCEGNKKQSCGNVCGNASGSVCGDNNCGAGFGSGTNGSASNSRFAGGSFGGSGFSGGNFGSSSGYSGNSYGNGYGNAFGSSGVGGLCTGCNGCNGCGAGGNTCGSDSCDICDDDYNGCENCNTITYATDLTQPETPPTPDPGN